MRHEFVNEQPVAIDPGPPSKMQSEIVVTDLGQATLENLEVHIDITHTWTGDLRITLASPDGTHRESHLRPRCSLPNSGSYATED